MITEITASITNYCWHN